MSLRIGFDLDGVLADMEGELARHAEALFGPTIGRGVQESTGAGSDPESPAAAARPGPESADGEEDVPPIVAPLMSSRQQRRLWKHVQSIENFWETLKEIEPGVVGRLGTLARERRWEIIFLTKRPGTSGYTAQLQTQRWLEANGFALPSVFVVQGSRGRIASSLALDFVVDDRPENCLDVVTDSRARAILVWRDAENRLPGAARRLGIGVVRTVDECLDILAKAGSREEDKPGMIDRVKRLLRKKDSARV
jgi:hypothetical protein